MTILYEAIASADDAMSAYLERTQRTTLWGVQNLTNESVEVAFGQMTSPYDIPNGTKNTGVIQLCQNTAPGASCTRDPIQDTGGKHIAARFANYSVLMAGETDPINEKFDAGEGFYWNTVTIIIEYRSATPFSANDRSVKISMSGERVALPKT